MLELFKSLPVARELHHPDRIPERARTFRRDTLTLGWEDRLKARGRRVTDGGVEFGTALPRGTVLKGGDCLLLDDAAIVVTVIERNEPVFVIAPQSSREWATVAYHIGNSHLPLMIDEACIVCPDIPGAAQVLELHEIRFSRALRSFTPIAGPADHRHQ